MYGDKMTETKLLKQYIKSRKRVEKLIEEVEEETGIKLNLNQAEARLTEWGYEKYAEEEDLQM